MNCEEIQEKISMMLDGELSEIDRAGLMEHIDNCPECKAVYHAFSALSDSLDTLEAVPDGFTEDVMRHIHAQPGIARKKRWLPGVLSMAACVALVLFAGRGFLADNKAKSSMNSDMNRTVAPMMESQEASDSDFNGEADAQRMSYDSAIIYQNSYFSEPDNDPEPEEAGVHIDDPGTGSNNFVYGSGTNKLVRNAFGASSSVSPADLDDVLSVADPADYGSLDRGSDYTILFQNADGTSYSLDIWVDGERLYCEDTSEGIAYYANGTYAQLLAVIEE